MTFCNWEKKRFQFVKIEIHSLCRIFPVCKWCMQLQTMLRRGFCSKKSLPFALGGQQLKKPNWTRHSPVVEKEGIKIDNTSLSDIESSMFLAWCRPLSVWFLFRTSGNTDWYGDPPEHGNFWENWFFTGKIDHQGHKNPQTYETTCHLGCGTCQNFFSFTFVAVGATFLKVTLKLLRRMTWFPADLSTWFLTPYCQLNSARGLHNANLLLCL